MARVLTVVSKPVPERNAASSAPVVLSHSNAHALCPHPRNAPDDLIKAVAASGGVVMATFVPSFINPDLWSRIEKAKRARWPGATPAERAAMQDPPESEIGPLPLATLAQYCDHVEYLLKLIGPDHVGIGGDLDGIDSTPTGLEGVETYPALIAELLRRGYSEADCEKIAGGNLLRAMEAAEKVAAGMAGEVPPDVKP
jgi:membrane dipeptidase